MVEDCDILRVHDFEYLMHLKDMCNKLPEQVEGDVFSSSFESSGQLDFDSPISKKVSSLFHRRLWLTCTSRWMQHAWEQER